MRDVDPNVCRVAALMGDPVRASILFALMDAAESPASELAARADASPQAASSHLSKLVEGGLLQVRASGRQRLFRLASHQVAAAIEALAGVAPPAQVVSLDQHIAMQKLRAARSCYDHLAGRLGVAVTDALVAYGAMKAGKREFSVTPSGVEVFELIGVDVAAARSKTRSFARSCLDWTERRPHLAGALGAALLECVLEAGWVARNRGNRSLRVTPLGERELVRAFGIRLADAS